MVLKMGLTFCINLVIDLNKEVKLWFFEKIKHISYFYQFNFLALTMLQKIKHLFAVLLLAGFAAQPALAESFDQDDMAFAFGNAAVSSDLGYMALLSSQEMMETEGEWGFIRYVPRTWGYVKTFRVRSHYDVKPHRFSNYWGPLRGDRPHYQLTFYRKGVQGAHMNMRIPWGSRTTWGSHRR